MRTHVLAAVLALASAGTLVPRLAHADDEAPDAASAHALGRKQNFWKLGAGVRVNDVADAGFDPYAKNDVLVQWSMDAQKTLFLYDRFSFSAGVGWDIGGREGADTRGDASGLLVNRLDVPLEGRYHLAPWLYGFLRVAPGAVVARAHVDDASSSTTLTGGGWGFACDASLGASFLLGSHRHAEKRLVRVWLTPEAGWAWSTAIPMRLTPSDRGDDPRAVGETDLGSLALRGPFARLTVAMTF